MSIYLKVNYQFKVCINKKTLAYWTSEVTRQVGKIKFKFGPKFFNLHSSIGCLCSYFRLSENQNSNLKSRR